MGKPLRELQHGRRFYCQRNLPAAAAVDHFIPWSALLYARYGVVVTLVRARNPVSTLARSKGGEPQ